METQRSKLENLLGLGTVFFLVVAYLIPVYYYPTLPDQIPIHFNASGIADSFGDKGMVWFMPILASVICFGLNKLRKNFQKLNPRITDHQSRVSEMSLLIVGFLISLSFSYISIQMVLISLGKSENLGIWFLPTFIIAFLILPFLPLFKLGNRN